MSKLGIKSKSFLFTVSNLEKKHKVITYASLLFLTVSTYFLRTENQNVKIDFATLKERNENLKKNMVIFNRTYKGFPLPVWQKVKRGNEFILQYINPEYVNTFGHIFDNNEFNLIGRNNFQLGYPKNMAQKNYEHDIAVSITGNKIETIEEAIDKEGKLMKFKVIKWRDINDNKDTLVYGILKEMINPKKVKIKK